MGHIAHANDGKITRSPRKSAHCMHGFVEHLPSVLCFDDCDFGFASTPAGMTIGMQDNMIVLVCSWWIVATNMKIHHRIVDGDSIRVRIWIVLATFPIRYPNCALSENSYRGANSHFPTLNRSQPLCTIINWIFEIWLFAERVETSRKNLIYSHLKLHFRLNKIQIFNMIFRIIPHVTFTATQTLWNHLFQHKSINWMCFRFMNY